MSDAQEYSVSVRCCYMDDIFSETQDAENTVVDNGVLLVSWLLREICLINNIIGRFFILPGRSCLIMQGQTTGTTRTTLLPNNTWKRLIETFTSKMSSYKWMLSYGERSTVVTILLRRYYILLVISIAGISIK